MTITSSYWVAGPVEIVDWPMKNGGFPHLSVSLPRQKGSRAFPGRIGSGGTLMGGGFAKMGIHFFWMGIDHRHRTFHRIFIGLSWYILGILWNFKIHWDLTGFSWYTGLTKDHVGRAGEVCYYDSHGSMEKLSENAGWSQPQWCRKWGGPLFPIPICFSIILHTNIAVFFRSWPNRLSVGDVQIVV